MKHIRNILLLSRPVNLIIILITMIVVRYDVLSDLANTTHIGMQIRLNLAEFLLLALSALIVTAAGNIINDYFDQKVDKINKPAQVIVGKSVDRRMAILLHQSLNIAAVLLTSILCFRYSYWWPLVLVISIITLLWWYSPILKKKIFIGNLAVALCTASVPLWASIFDIHALKTSYSDMLVDSSEFFSSVYLWIGSISLFAFILTLIREAVKDMEDMAGDSSGDYHTIPLVYGIDGCRKYLTVLFGIYLLASGAMTFMLDTWLSRGVSILLVVLPGIYVMWITVQAKDHAAFTRSSAWIKYLMALGLIALVIIS